MKLSTFIKLIITAEYVYNIPIRPTVTGHHKQNYKKIEKSWKLANTTAISNLFIENHSL
jgi:hypothetical protein